MITARIEETIDAPESARAEPEIDKTTLSKIQGSSRSRAVVRALAAMALLAGSQGVASASGPRWVTGPPYFTGQPGIPVVWYTGQPLYFTDPGDLSASVNHAAADALVAAAAGVWNVPTANLTLAYGGALSEHVSGANAYLSVNGPVFPADVSSSNYAAKQIAVIYDSDGSVTDLLLGGGASSPAECLQNAVTESVDSIVPAGYIQHALLVLNGRCTGPAPQQQLQMRYQLQRAFGRVLGLAWSQTNDNVFTQATTPTYVQALHWPIMHPIDIVCGPYTYQCLPLPFTLRDDDIAGITNLYLIGYSNLLNWTGFWPTLPGKGPSYADAAHAFGFVNFPTGQGMSGVNVVVKRQEMFTNIPDAFEDSSSVTGFLYQRNGGNPVTGTGSGMAASMGSPNGQWNYNNYGEGYYDLAYIPMINASQQWVDVTISTEPVNPLYTGTHAVGPYGSGAVTPSGPSLSSFTAGLYPDAAGFYAENISFTASAAANSCTPGADGVETAPAPVAAGGWWKGLLCAHGHTSWASFAAQAGRTATVEVTALDENGLATTGKTMPLIGVWGATDPAGTLPTVASTPSAFNTVTLGMTAAGLWTSQAEGLRLAISDQRGVGRPDFAYQARVLYADNVQPAATSASGGQITINGMGFRAGNEVTVNGVAAVATSWSASSIVAVAPPESAFPVNPSGAVDVAVIDLSTGGTTVMTGALTYGGVAPDAMELVSAPAGMVPVGTPAATPFAVRMFLGDGVTPVAGLPVTFSAGPGSARFAGCAATPCTVLTDATGLATATVTPTAPGTVTVVAAAVGASQTATFNAVSESIAAVQPAEYVAAGETVAWAPQVVAIENGEPAVGQAVLWTGSSGMAVASGSSMVNGLGVAQIAATVAPLAGGALASGQACAWSSTPATTMCVEFSAVGVAPPAWRLAVVSGAGQTVALAAAFAPVVLLVSDGQGHPVAGAPVTIHQTADAAGMPCPARGACPVAPLLGSSVAAGVSDANGLVSVTPIQVVGQGEVTNIAVSAGTQGFASLSIEQEP
jgi:hypothetical protein